MGMVLVMGGRGVIVLPTSAICCYFILTGLSDLALGHMALSFCSLRKSPINEVAMHLLGGGCDDVPNAPILISSFLLVSTL